MKSCIHRAKREEIFIYQSKYTLQYQYHKTITSGRLPEGITHQAGCLNNDNSKNKSIGREKRIKE